MNTARAFPGLDNPGSVAATVISGAAIVGAMAWRFGWTPPLAPYAYFAATGIIVSATDLAARRVPNPVVLPAYLIGPALLAVGSAPSGTWWPLARAALAIAVLGGFYLLLGLAFPAGMGLGDVKWAGVIGVYLGWLNWSAVVVGTLLGFLVAAAALAIGRLAGRCRASLPMAPFMTLGALVAVLTSK